MGKILKFSVDKQKITQGEWVTVSWECEDPDAVSLTVVDTEGNSRNIIHLADSGAQAVTLDLAGKTVIRLNAVFGGKAQREEVTVKVAKKKQEKAKDSQAKEARYEGPGRKSNSSKNPFSNPFSNLGQKWNTFIQRLAYGWSLLPQRRRRIYKAIIWGIIAFWFFSIAQGIGYKAGYQKGLEEAPVHTVNNI